LSFHAVEGTATADPPVEVILLVDEVNTSFERVAFERDQIEQFLRRNGGELARPVSLVFLSDSGATIGKTSSQDGNAVIADLKQKESGLRTIGRSQGFYGASDRQQLSLHAIEQLADYEATKPGRKLVVWISPGWPLLSGPGEASRRRCTTRRWRFHESVDDDLDDLKPIPPHVARNEGHSPPPGVASKIGA
jgi:hypothetical protein